MDGELFFHWASCELGRMQAQDLAEELSKLGYEVFVVDDYTVSLGTAAGRVPHREPSTRLTVGVDAHVEASEAVRPRNGGTMRDWQEGRLRYLVHFNDGRSGMRFREAQLDVGDELAEGAERYVVERVEQPGHGQALGHAWAARVMD